MRAAELGSHCVNFRPMMIHVIRAVKLNNSFTSDLVIILILQKVFTTVLSASWKNIKQISYLKFNGATMINREENERIAQWAGLECRCEKYSIPTTRTSFEIATYYGNCPRHSNNGNPPDYDRDEVAILLLPILTAKTDYVYILKISPAGETYCGPYHEEPKCMMRDDFSPTIAAAIKSAVLQLEVKR
jgi:hypothetical protein